MVQIYIKTSDEDEKIEEWSIIELQGDLEIETGESLTNKFMGDLHFSNEGVPILILGHHVLYGKVMKLDKPFVLLKKNRTVLQSINFVDNDDKKMDCEEVVETKTATSYLVKAIIRNKLLFNKRPRPIVYVETKTRS